MRSPDINNTFNNKQEEYINEIKHHGYKYIKIALCLLGIWMFILAFGYKIQNETDVEVYSLVFVGTSFFTITYFANRYPQFNEYIPFLTNFICIVNVTEQQFTLDHVSSKIPQPFLPIAQFFDYFNLIILIDRKRKNISNIVTFSYFVFRTYFHYGSISANCLFPVITYLIINNEISKIYEQQLKKISELYTRKEEAAAENFCKTLEIIPQGVILISLSDKGIQYSNQEALVILGVLDINQIQHSLSQYMLKDKDIQYPQEPFKSAKGLNESIYHSMGFRMSLDEYLMKIKIDNFEQKDLIFKNKEAKKYLQVKAQIINRNQSDQQLIVILNDITRIKQLESQSKKILSMFFASVAHELRTPLNSIIPMTQKLEKLVKDQNILKYVKIIKNSSLFLQNIIEDALDMSRIENSKFTLDEDFFSIKDIVNEVQEIMDFQIQAKKLNLFFSISNNVPHQIKTDCKRYKQILFNLIGNAVKFTFKGSITCNIDFIDNFLITQIIDTGIGIKPEDIDKLFRFFGKASDSKKINRGGMGFGLTISKMILTQLNGDITVDSVSEQGSTFTFRIKIQAFKNTNHIPYSRILNENIQQYDYQNYSEAVEHRLNANLDINAMYGETYRSQIVLTNESDLGDLPSIKFHQLNSQQLTYFDKSPTTLNNSNVEHSNLNDFNSENLNLLLREAQEFKVLVVDDSSYNLFVMSEVLKCIESVGDIYQAFNGKEAIEVIMNQANLKTNTTISAFDVIFMDLHMPILDGFQTIEKLRELEDKNKLNLQQTKIIAVSAITKNQFRNSANSNLFDDFMEKPVNEIQLLKIFNP